MHTTMVSSGRIGACVYPVALMACSRDRCSAQRLGDEVHKLMSPWRSLADCGTQAASCGDKMRCARGCGSDECSLAVSLGQLHC